MPSNASAAPVVQSVLELIGQTPIVKLRNVCDARGAQVWAKCEHLNPGGSVKDRICLAMIEDAEKRGLIKAGDTIVEPTSGNTGIGLAMVCAKKGYKLVLTMPASMSLERRSLLQAYGAEIVLTAPEEVMQGAVREAQRIAKERGAYMPQQFENPANPATHLNTTAQEILQAFEGESIAVFIAAVGTGGTISGVGSVLKQKNSKTRVIAVEPETSQVLAGKQAGPSKIQGINAGFVPKNYNARVVDEIRSVSDRAAWDMKQALSKKEGLLVGISAGANVHVACEIAKSLSRDQHVLTVLCDTGERYFSLAEYFP